MLCSWALLCQEDFKRFLTVPGAFSCVCRTGVGREMSTEMIIIQRRVLPGISPANC